MDAQELNYIKETQRAHQWKMAFFGLLFLIVGIVIGAGAGILILGRRPAAPQGRPDQYVEMMTRRMERELNLSEPQARQIRQVTREHLQTLDQIRRETHPQIQAELTAMNQRILEVLDPQQQQIWQEKTRQLRNRFGQDRPGPGPRGPGFGRGQNEVPSFDRRQGEGRGYNQHRQGPRLNSPQDGPPPIDPNLDPPPPYGTLPPITD